MNTVTPIAFPHPGRPAPDPAVAAAMPQGSLPAALVEFWIRGRRDRCLPDRSRFDAPNLKPWLGHLSIYEAVGDYADFRNRLDGTEIADLAGESWQGCLASELDRRHGTSLLSALRKVAVWRHPVVETLSLCQKPYIRMRRVLLPVTRDGRRVDEVFLGLFPRCGID